MSATLAAALLGALTLLTVANVGAAPVAAPNIAAGHDDLLLDLSTAMTGDLVEAQLPGTTVGGVTITAVTTKSQTATVDAAYLADVDIYFDGLVLDTGNGDPEWTAAEVDAIETWVNAGGVLITNEDSPIADQLGAEFGAPTAGSDEVPSTLGDQLTAVGSPSAAVEDIIDGPFGTWTTIDLSGLIAHFGATAPAGWEAVATYPGGEVGMMYSAVGTGHVLVTGDTDMFSQNVDQTDGGPNTPQEIMVLNVFAWAVSLTDDSAGPAPTPTPTATPSVTPTPTPGPTPTPTPTATPTATPEPTPDPEVVLCDGVEATVVGTSGSDELEGTAERDVIHGLGGDDVIDGLGGNDLICAGAGDDVVNAGPGRDLVYAGKGDDIVRGGKGADELHGQNGNDTIRGKNGADEIFGGRKADRIWGNNGEDTIEGGAGADEIYGGKKEDTLWGNKGNDTLNGGAADDLLRGGQGTDTCIGGSGFDLGRSCESFQ